MNLNGRGAIDPRLIPHVQMPLASFQNVKIKLWDMHLGEGGPDDYDWRTNTTTSDVPRELLYEGDAQMQIFRFTLTMDGPVGSVDQYRTVRFTVGRNDIGDGRINKGMVVEVTECTENPSATTYQYIVASGLNSGTPFRRTIETEVDMQRVAG